MTDKNVLLELECRSWVLAGDTEEKGDMALCEYHPHDGHGENKFGGWQRIVARWENRVPVEEKYERPEESLVRLWHVVQKWGKPGTQDIELVLRYVERLEDAAKAAVAARPHMDPKFEVDLNLDKALIKAGW